MNANTLARIADAITLERNRASLDQNRGSSGVPSWENHLSGKSSPGPDLRRGGASNKQVGRRSGNNAYAAEIEDMKRRLLKHAFVALIIVLMFIGFHFVNKWPH